MSPLFNNFNINLIDGHTAVALLIFIASGGTLATLRRNWQLARQADPEAVELAVTHAVQGGVAPGSANNAENTPATEDTGAVEDTSAVVGGVTLGVGDDEEALQKASACDDAGTSEVCGTVDDGIGLSGDVCGVAKDGVAVVGEACGALEDSIAVIGEAYGALKDGVAVVGEVCGMVEDGVAVVGEACSALKDGVAVIGEVCGTVEDGVTVGVDAST